MTLRNRAEKHVDRAAFCSTLFLSILFICSATIQAQQPTTNRDQKKVPDVLWEDLYKAPGSLLSKGSNKVAVGKLKLKSHRLDQVFLPSPFEFETDEPIRRTIFIESKIRLTITGESFSAGPYVIWLNDERLENVMSGPKELRVVIDDLRVLEDGATIQVASGAGCVTNSLSTLPEKLRVPARLRRPPPEEKVEKIEIKMRSVSPTNANQAQPDVIIEITREAEFDLSRNAGLAAQIGRQYLIAIPTTLKTVTIRMRAEQFSQAKDGDRIKLNYGFCTPGGTYVGRFDKSLLDR